MDAELKGKWVKALRSGKYKQGKGVLCDRGKHCCLGVLCRVAGGKYSRGRFTVLGEEAIHHLPRAFLKKSGISESDEIKLAKHERWDRL